jgi:uncharacterized membrane protein YqjE
MIDSATDPSQDGWKPTQALRDLFSALTSALHTRLELFVVELQEELEGLKRSLALFLIVLASIGAGFVLFNIFLVALFWQNGWIIAIGVLALVYFGIGVVAAIKLRASLRRPAGLFAATLAELGKDRDRLKASRHES